MCLRSVVTVDLGRYYCCKQLALHAGEGGWTEHERDILLHTGFEDAWVEAHNVHDVPDASGSAYRFLEFVLEKAGSLLHGYLFDPRHFGRYASNWCVVKNAEE